MTKDSAPAAAPQLCPACGALLPPRAARCPRCDLAISVRRIALPKLLPDELSASAVLGAAMLLIHLRMMIAFPGEGFLSWSPEAYLKFGALFPPLLREGQWWRLSTANFVHVGGLLHLFFNLSALSQVGPFVERVYGRAGMTFLFVVTGIGAMSASAIFSPMSPTSGASGSLMGLIGVAAALGHHARRHPEGRAAREKMLQWAAYTMVFGFLVNANHAAHAGGFLLGGAIGLALTPSRIRAWGGGYASAGLGVLGVVIAAATCALCLFPLPSASAHSLEGALARAADRKIRDALIGACAPGVSPDDAKTKLEPFFPGLDEAAVSPICETVKDVREGCDKPAEAGQPVNAEYARLLCGD